MALGLNVQCSICEGSIKNLKESPLSGSALQGNQLKPTVRTRGGSLAKKLPSHVPLDFATVAVDADNPFYYVSDGTGSYTIQYLTEYTNDNRWVYPMVNTPTDWYKYCAYGYYSCSVNFSDVSGSSYSVNFNFAANGFPSMTGNLPASIDPNSGSNYIWGTVISSWGGPYNYYNGMGGQVTSSVTATEKHIRFRYASYDSIDVVLSNQVDFTGNYTTCLTDIQSQTWQSSTGSAFNGFRITYNELYPQLGVTDMRTVTTSSYTYNQITAQLTSSSGDGMPLPNVHAANGWDISLIGAGNGCTLKIYKGQGQYYMTGSGPNYQPYFIGSFQSYNAVGNIVLPTASYTSSNVFHVISQGNINQNQVIGYGADIQLDFPTDTPFPITGIGGVPLVASYIFAVIGQDPNDWAKANGYKFT